MGPFAFNRERRLRGNSLFIAGFIVLAACVILFVSFEEDADKAILKHAPSSTVQKSLLNTSAPSPAPTTSPSPAPSVVPRWNTSQLDEHFVNLSSFDNSDLLQLVPKPVSKQVELYNRDAWHRLRELLGFESTSSAGSNKNATTVCLFNGGSSTAGGGGTWRPQRYDAMFRTLMTISQKESIDIQVVNRGHGSRGSTHTAYLLPNFISADDTDVLVWEFSQNDVGEKVGCPEVNKGLITWLDHVKNYFQNPPLVILVYIWRSPFEIQENPRKVPNVAFDCHRRIGATYDFVVGSVNLGAYVESLGFDFDRSKERFLADRSHPNRWGHWFLAFLLWDLVTDEDRSVVSINASSLPEEPRWDCKQDSEGKKRIMDIANNYLAFASWTGETPRNERHQYGIMYPRLMTNAELASETSVEKNMSALLDGKAVDYRKDRKFSVVLPCCDTEERIIFDVPTDEVTKQGARGLAADIQGKGKAISAIQFRSPEISYIRQETWTFLVQSEFLKKSLMIYFLDSQGEKLFNGTISNSGSGNTSITDPEWVVFDARGGETCHFTYITYNSWLLLPKDALVSRIDFCNKNPQCGMEGVRELSLEQLVLF